MKTSIVEITPKLAAELLGNNARNRKLRASVVKRYANDIELGLWRLSGEPIILNSEGAVVDGQHRLAAVVGANKSIRSVLVEGADPSVFDVVDCGLPRKAQDALEISGYERARWMALIGRRLCMAWEHGVEKAFYDGKPSSVLAISNARLVEFCRTHARRIIGSINAIVGIGDIAMSPILPTTLMSVHSMLDREHQEKFVEFASQIVLGLNATPGGVTHLLRRNLIAQQQQYGRVSLRLTAGVLIKAWNHFLAGTSPGAFIRFRSDEAFPELTGASR